MPENNVRVPHDNNIVAFVKNVAHAYGEMGLVSKRIMTNVVAMSNSVDAMNRVIEKIGQMDSDNKKIFCNYFVGENLEYLNMATDAPEILAGAYQFLSEHQNDDDASRNRFHRIGEYVDALADEFEQSGGVVINGKPIDTNNIANVYEGLGNLFASRRADTERTGDSVRIAKLDKILDQTKTVIAEYDNTWGIAGIRPEYAESLEGRAEDLWDALNRAELSPEIKENIKKWKFVDANNNEISQFNDRGQLDRAGRLAAIIDLSRHSCAKKHATRVSEKIDEDALAAELNQEIESKLYEMAVADKIVGDAIRNPEQFQDAEYRQNLLQELSEYGATISDNAYKSTIDAEINATAGWATRVKAKLGTAGENVGDFFGKMFRPLKRVDRFANVRISRNMADKREKRIEFFKRILVGFSSAFVASAIITTIATAAAAAAGMSIAASMAAIGFITAIGIGVIQVNLWRQEQKKSGKPTEIHAFLENKRLVASLGITLVAVVAMCFGAAGMTTAAKVAGFSALGLGATKNAIESGMDTWGNGGSLAQSIIAGIMNAGAVIAGGITGRLAANLGINWFNARHTDSLAFKTTETHTEQRDVTKEIEHTRTVTDYSDEMTQRAENAVKGWYSKLYPDNPEILQQNIDAVNQYNAEYNQDINPYRALRIIEMCRPSYGTYTGPEWQQAHGYTPEQIDLAARAIGPDGRINPDGMEIVRRLDLNDMGARGEVGAVRGHEMSGNYTYRPIQDLPTQHTETYTETIKQVEDFDVTTQQRARGDVMATFGNDNAYGLKKHIGAFWSKVNDRFARRDNRTSHGLPAQRETTENPVLEPVFKETETKEIERPVLEPVLDDVDFGEVFKSPTDTGTDTDAKKILPYDNEIVERAVLQPVVKETEIKKVEKPVLESVVDIQSEPIMNIADDKILVLTRPQAKSWHDLHARLDKVRKKLDKSPHGSKAAKLHAEESKLQYYINNLRNELGHYDDATIERATREALLRETLNEKQRLIDAKNSSSYEIAKLDKKINEQIKEFGADIESGARADKSRLVFPIPVPGVQRQKKDERGDFKLPSENDLHPRADEIVMESHKDIVEPENTEYKKTKAERRAQRREQKKEQKDRRRQEHEKLVALLPQKVERFNLFRALDRALNKVSKNNKPERSYFVPDALEQLVYNANLIESPITTIRGVPVHLMDLGNNGNPITQNREKPMVVVEIRQNIVRDGINDTDVIRVPFYLATGTERHSMRPTGHWYPMSVIHSNGEIFEDEGYDIPELMHIAKALDVNIGDIRNWRDDTLTQRRELAGRFGFVGGSDAMQHVNPELVKKIIAESVHDNKSLYNYNPEYTAVARDWMEDALADIQSPDYRAHRRRIGAGIKNVAHRALNRFGFGRDEFSDDENER